MENPEVDKHKYFNYTDPAPEKATDQWSKKRSCYVKPLKNFYDLLKQVGFTDYSKRREVVNYVYENHKYYWWIANHKIIENDGPEKVLKSFLDDREKIKNKIKRSPIQDSKKITASEVGDFTFCPASFSINSTFKIEPTASMEAGIESHEEKNLENFLSALYTKRKRESFPKEWIRPITARIAGMVRGGEPIIDWEIEGKSIDDFDEQDLSEDQIKKIYQGSWGDLLQSKLIHSGHSDELDKIYFSNKGNLSGVPDYIFKNKKNNNLLIVEEKHTWNEVVDSPFENHIMQLTAYLNLNYEKNTVPEKGYLIYFSWDLNFTSDNVKRKKYKNPRIHEIINNKSNLNRLKNKFIQIKSLIDSGVMNFDNTKISASKCFNCSARALCLHKNTNLGKLYYPYDRKS